MTTPFGQLIETMDTIDGTGGGTVGIGTAAGGGAGGTTSGGNTPTNRGGSGGGCNGDSDCPMGFYCDTNNVLGYAPTPEGGDPYSIPIYGCVQITTPTPTPTPVGEAQCGADGFGACPMGMTCVRSSVDGGYSCVREAITPQCPSAGTLASCINETGQALLYTGQRDVTGACATSPGTSLECLQCPPEGQFLQCIGSVGTYSSGKIPGVSTCQEYQVNDDPRCSVGLPLPPPLPTPTPIPKTCTPPSTNQVIEIQCVNIDAQRYVGGIARQAQTRTYDPNGPEGTLCTTQEWQNTGNLDTSLCQIREDVGPVKCIAPSSGFSRTVAVPCSQISAEYASGTAQQRQIRRYNQEGPTDPNTGLCYYTEWENDGQPDTTTCSAPIFWRSCITGELVAGSPPTGYIENNYRTGGTCWEPVGEVSFEPSLNNALRYSYQRGSTKYPTAKTIKATNPSYTNAFKLTLKTNSNIKLTQDGISGNGTISFILEPRTSKSFTINVTPELLQSLQDGTSSLSMSVEYERVIE